MRLIGTLMSWRHWQACSRTAQLSLFDTQELGTVDLPVSCSAVAASEIEHGLALLHHMAYTEADLVFQSVLEEDPSCSMGCWGRAKTLIHPRWPDNPTGAELDQGLAFVEQALALGPRTERERAYIDAVGAYCRGAQGRDKGASELLFHLSSGLAKRARELP